MDGSYRIRSHASDFRDSGWPLNMIFAIFNILFADPFMSELASAAIVFASSSMHVYGVRLVGFVADILGSLHTIRKKCRHTYPCAHQNIMVR